MDIAKTILASLLIVPLLLPQSAVQGQPVIPETASPKGPAQAGTTELYAGSPLCLPDVYLAAPSDCLPLGPSTFLTENARLGLTFPEQPIPAQNPDPALSALPERYLSVQANGDIPLYASLEAAEARDSSGSIEGGKGLHYVTILQRVDNPQGTFYQITSGEWISTADVTTACCTTSGGFQGLLFPKTPPHDFGWVLSPTKTKTRPGYDSPDTGRELNREQVVQIYAMQQVGDSNWLLIGADEWADDQYVGRVSLAKSPPEGVTNQRWIEVNLAEQTLSVYDQGQLVFATLNATGAKPYYTRPGLFQIYKKKALETMTGSFEPGRGDYYYLADVPWTMYFDAARALHGAYWRTLYGYPASHGCVNLTPGDSQWLFNWAKEGDWVYVWDPTGKTPTDPSFYGAGGA